MVLRHPLNRGSLLPILRSLALLLFSVLCSTSAKAGTKAESDNVLNWPCTKEIPGRKITLDITPKPVRHMADLTFRVTITPCTSIPSTLVLDLSMPGMYMGKNQVVMTRKEPCIWEGKGVIVSCMSGRKLWRATILSSIIANPAFNFELSD
ncbi:MAG TPA: hypothetical protein VN371_02520 [Chlorobaculum sp.]|nr:hypothetical protein [Chlorobaculum sp.]